MLSSRRLLTSTLNNDNAPTFSTENAMDQSMRTARDHPANELAQKNGSTRKRDLREVSQRGVSHALVVSAEISSVQ